MYYQASGRSSRFSRWPARKRRLPLKAILIVVVLIGALGAGAYALNNRSTTPKGETITTKTTTAKGTSATTSSPAVAATPATTVCTSNTLSQNVIVSISKRHLWACTYGAVSYDSAVVTGMENLPADLTPVGTYHIYDKETDQYLKGSDSTGSWDDYVNYWMPWLSNQYGIYGFHDATWRAPSDFGNISPYSSNASHGCVELPLATAKWIYDWSQIGTTVTIEA